MCLLKCYNEENIMLGGLHMKAIELKPVEAMQIVASKCNCGACNCNCGAGSACMNKCMSGETVDYKDALKAVYSK